MRTYTTQEASEITGVSVRALRKRVERGQLRAVQQGRYWRIPRAELERAELLSPLDEGTQELEGTEGTGHDSGAEALLRKLESTRAENVRLTQELARLRPLPQQVETVTQDLHRERSERQAAEARALESRSWQERLADAGWRERRRMLRELRAEHAA